MFMQLMNYELVLVGMKIQLLKLYAELFFFNVELLDE